MTSPFHLLKLVPLKWKGLLRYPKRKIIIKKVVVQVRPTHPSNVGQQCTVTYFISGELDWILLSEDVRDFEKAQIGNDFSFPSLEIGSFETEGLVEISQAENNNKKSGGSSETSSPKQCGPAVHQPVILPLLGAGGLRCSVKPASRSTLPSLGTI